MLLMLFAPIVDIAAGINVTSGASMTLGGGTVDMGCTDATITGNFDIGSGIVQNARHFNIAGGSVNAGSGQIQLAGDWSNSGTFTRGSSQVTIQDGCAISTSALTGDTGFHAFTASSASGKTLQAAAGSTQVFNSSLTLEGLVGDPLLIRSSVTGNQAFFSLVPDGTQNIYAVDVEDNNAIGGQLLAPGQPSDYDSVDSGNNLNWFLNFVEQVPIPTLSRPALIVLALALMSLAFRRRRILLIQSK